MSKKHSKTNLNAQTAAETSPSPSLPSIHDGIGTAAIVALTLEKTLGSLLDNLAKLEQTERIARIAGNCSAIAEISNTLVKKLSVLALGISNAGAQR